MSEDTSARALEDEGKMKELRCETCLDVSLL
jgi:hypothetical protein